MKWISMLKSKLIILKTKRKICKNKNMKDKNIKTLLNTNYK